MNSTTLAATLLLLVIGGINVFAMYLWNRVNTLIHQTSAEAGRLVGDHVARLYTQYLYNQLLSSGKQSSGPKLIALGNPENDKVIRAAKASDEYTRIESLASYIRGLPVNIVLLMQ
jgi:hypothetical protein